MRTSPNLSPFNRHEAPIFFGRESASQDLAQQVQLMAEKNHTLIVTAPADSGKSSLVQAGLLPLLEQTKANWQILDFVINDASITSSLIKLMFKHLNAVTENTIIDFKQFQQQLKQQNLPIDLINNQAINPTLLIIDPLETILQSRYSDKEQDLFFKIIQMVTEMQHFSVLMVLDQAYLELAQHHINFSHLLAQGHIQLPAINIAECLEILQKTANIYHLDFAVDPNNNISLDRSVANLADGCHLSELNFLLQQWYQKDQKSGLLSYETYQSLGGLNALSQQLKRLWQRYPANIYVSCLSFIKKLSGTQAQNHIRIACPANKLRQTPRQRHLFDDMTKYGLLHINTNKQVYLNQPIFKALQHCALQNKAKTIKISAKISVSEPIMINTPKMPDLRDQILNNNKHQGLGLLAWLQRFMVFTIIVVVAWALVQEYQLILPVNRQEMENNTKKDEVVANQKLNINQMQRLQEQPLSLVEFNKPADNIKIGLFGGQHHSRYYLNKIDTYQIQWQKTPQLLLEKALMKAYIQLAKAYIYEQQSAYISPAYRHALNYADKAYKKDNSNSFLTEIAQLQEQFADALKAEKDIKTAWLHYQKAFKIYQYLWQKAASQQLRQTMENLRQKMLHINQG